jgi:Lipocalin-like domain
MKNQSTLFLSAILGLTLLLSSCKKSNNDDNPAPPASKTKTELITQGSWKFDNVTVAGAPFSDNPSVTCYKDNIMVFTPNLQGTIDESTNICSTPAPPTFTWSFQSTESILNISAILFPGGSSSFTLVSLDENKLVVSQSVTMGIPVNVVLTFKH